MPAPFDLVDVARCEKLNRQLSEIPATGEERATPAFVMKPVLYKTGGVISKPIDLPKDSDSRSTELSKMMYSSDDPQKKAASCVIQGTNWKLQEFLNEAGKESMHASNFAIELHKNKVASTDIPVNLGYCDSHTGVRTAHLVGLAFTPKNCHIDNVHVHNQNDNNPATHLHIQCWDVDDSTLNYVRTLVKSAMDVGYEMCVGRGPTKMTDSTAKAFGVCVKKCELKKSKKKNIQTRMIMY